MLNLRIATSSGTKKVQIAPTATLGELRLSIWRKTGVPWAEDAKCQRLTHGRNLLSTNDYQPISGTGIANGDVLQLVSEPSCLANEETYLHVSSGHGEREAARRIIEEQGGGAMVRDSLSRTPAHYAALGRHGGIMEDLVGVGEDCAAARSGMGCTPLYYGRTDVGDSAAEAMEELGCGGADVNSEDVSGERPIDCTIVDADSSRVCRLMEWGAGLDTVEGNPIFYRVCHSGPNALVARLIDEFLAGGANMHIPEHSSSF